MPISCMGSSWRSDIIGSLLAYAHVRRRLDAHPDPIENYRRKAIVCLDMDTRRPALAVVPPIEPMLAKVSEELPPEGEFLYEPKWDGFRALVFRGDDVYIQSRDLRPFDRYFPDLHDALLARLPQGCIVDGEIVIATAEGL